MKVGESGNMSSDAPESTQQAVSVLLYRAILSVLAHVMACETEWREVDRNLAEAVVLECARFIFGSFVRRRVLHCFFST